VSVTRLFLRLVGGPNAKNAALGRIKHAHYALIVKVVSSAFSHGLGKLRARNGKRLHSGLSSAQGFRIIPKKGLRKREKLSYVDCSYGKKRRLAEQSRRAKATSRPGKPVTNGCLGGKWACLPRVLG